MWCSRQKFWSQTSDHMDRWKAEMGRVREKRRVEERRSEKRKSQKKEDGDARKGRKVAKHCISKRRWLAKAAGASHLARWEMKKCRLLWCEAHFEVKMYKTHHVRTTFGSSDVEKMHAVVARSTFPNVQDTPFSTTFGSWDVEKVHAVVARSTFASQNAQNTSASHHFWRFRSKKCMPLWREGHFEVKMLHSTTLNYTTPHYTTPHRQPQLQLQLQLQL